MKFNIPEKFIKDCKRSNEYKERFEELEKQKERLDDEYTELGEIYNRLPELEGKFIKIKKWSDIYYMYVKDTLLYSNRYGVGINIKGEGCKEEHTPKGELFTVSRDLEYNNGFATLDELIYDLGLNCTELTQLEYIDAVEDKYLDHYHKLSFSKKE